MARDTIIDLTLDSDSDAENEQSPRKTLLATFEPRKETIGTEARKHVRNSLARSNGYTARPPERESLVSILTQEVQKSALNGEARRSLATGDVIRQERVDKFVKYQEHRLANDSRIKPRANGNASPQYRQSQRNNSSTRRDHHNALDIAERISIHRRQDLNSAVGGVSAIRSPASDIPILSGSGLKITRTADQDRVPAVFSNQLKRLWPTLSDQIPSENAMKRPRISWQADHSSIAKGQPHRKPIALEKVEDCLPERWSYSDEPEIPVAKITPHKPCSESPSLTFYPKRPMPPEPKGFSSCPNRNGLPYSPEEDALLKRLKEEDGLAWHEIVTYFNGRTRGSLQVRYSTKFARVKSQVESTASGPIVANRQTDPALLSIGKRDQSPGGFASGRPKRARKSNTSVPTNFVSWKSLQNSGRESEDVSVSDETFEHQPELVQPTYLDRQDRTHPSSVSRILRQRELGSTSRRAWSNSRTVTEELKNHIFAEYGLAKRYHGTSGDVVSLSWSSTGTHFAAGSIAISDNRSMQYNMQRNLLLGDFTRGKLHELAEHHVHRPSIEDTGNVNGLQAMRESQDPRLFMTVSATEFSATGDRLYTTGTDRMLRHYSVGRLSGAPKCRYAVEHEASVDLLAVKAGHAIVATGCHIESNSIRLYRCHKEDYELKATFSPHRHDLQSKVDIFPSALKWGASWTHQNHLLAGFSGDEEKQLAGETCLWDGQTGQALELNAVTRNVFDVAWNPIASPASISFAVAANPSGLKLDRATRTVLHCFAPNQNGARRTMTWECPAVDINDVIFCPHDENLIATGATDGNVYVWDIRSADKSQQPLHTLRHGTSENVLPHNRDRELADTGVRFLSWGATKTRLYSGSSDGIVKVWNPYRSTDGVHVDDLPVPAKQRSAVMSGSFSPDYQELLIGTENGQINQFSMGGMGNYKVQSFKVTTAPPPCEKGDSLLAARPMVESDEIEIRPFGAMPLKQAVQGRNYKGPFLAPSTHETTEAERAYQQALCAQNEATSRMASENWDDSEDENVVKANQKVREAQQRLDDLSERFKHFTIAQPKAEEFQQSLQQDEKARKALESHFASDIEPCNLDCRVLSTEDEPEDSGRSELRIPGVLRSIAKTALLAKDELSDPTCVSCFPADLKRRRRILCAGCKLKQARLTTSCSLCAGPARVAQDRDKAPICERCSFSCFRCSRALQVSETMELVSCRACDLHWEAGVLGYELVSSNLDGENTTTPMSKTTSSSTESSSRVETLDDFGAIEMEHYASLWKSPEDGDGVMK